MNTRKLSKFPLPQQSRGERVCCNGEKYCNSNRNSGWLSAIVNSNIFAKLAIVITIVASVRGAEVAPGVESKNQSIVNDLLPTMKTIVRATAATASSSEEVERLLQPSLQSATTLITTKALNTATDPINIPQSQNYLPIDSKQKQYSGEKHQKHLQQQQEQEQQQQEEEDEEQEQQQFQYELMNLPRRENSQHQQYHHYHHLQHSNDDGPSRNLNQNDTKPHSQQVNLLKGSNDNNYKTKDGQNSDHQLHHHHHHQQHYHHQHHHPHHLHRKYHRNRYSHNLDHQQHHNHYHHNHQQPYHHQHNLYHQEARNQSKLPTNHHDANLNATRDEDAVTLLDVSPEVPQRVYHSKYSIDYLLKTKFEHQTSNDIDMDPCKAGGFMGDIALPDINYGDYPIVVHTRLLERNAFDKPHKANTNRLNDTFQKEMELLKQQVYHEGLQVEEEGLTDIVRRKTKLPNLKSDLNNDHLQINSANELLKPKPYASNTNYNYMKNNVYNNEVISTENYDSKSSHYIVDENTGKNGRQPIETETAVLTSKDTSSKGYNVSEENHELQSNGTNAKTEYDAGKYSKPNVGWINHNVDQRKIQSNTKDIVLDAGNNFVSGRRFVILPTALPEQRTINVGKAADKHLDDIQIIRNSPDTNTNRRRLQRRAQKFRRSFHDDELNINRNYERRLQQLTAELSQPVDEVAVGHIQTHPHINVKKSKPFHDHKSKSKFNHKMKSRSHIVSAYEPPITDNFQFVQEHRRLPRAVTAKKERVWEYGVIPYEIDGNFTGTHKALFKQAMRHWENFTCITFVERDPNLHPNYIVFTVRSCGCCSFVGKRGNGPQAISIGHNCDKFGIVVHELGHVVGFWHEHTRPDREKHVIIEPDNIMKGQDYNFNKLTPEEVNSLGMAYDYDSIMHYARNTFSKGTYLDTILPIEVKGKKRPEIGQRLRLSAGDIAQANLLYKCPKCGKTFQDYTGTFASPSYYTAGALTNESENCEWRITATHGERIQLKLENLNILKSENCESDYLEIRDGYYIKSPLIARFCGKVVTETLTSTTSRMLLIYVNNHRSEGYRGFKAEFEVLCGGEIAIVEKEGRLESPNYPLEYLPNKECIWKITAPKDYQVALKFQSFEVENHDSCIYDYVEVRDGPNRDSPIIGVFCGYKPPPSMKSIGDTMYVKFVSDSTVQKPGFSATFMKEVDECENRNHGCEHECINTLGGYECGCHIGYELHSDKKHCEYACGGVIEYPNGTITSPSFPDKYPLLKDCIWEIIAPPKHKISLNFTHFDLEGSTHHQSECGYDKVTIYSKLSENRLKRIGTYCGSSIPPTASSEGNALRIEFHSDKSIENTGFAAVFFTDIDECTVNNGGCQHDCRNTIGSYICSCHNGYSLHENGHDCNEGECKHEISAPFGTIYSPNYPDAYPPNADCVWRFSTTPGHRIKLLFNEFNIESHQECNYDYVIIYDGNSENNQTLGRFCGDKIPYPISSSTNELYMVLKTDKNKQYSGFTAVHSTSCGGYLAATTQVQKFYSHSRYGTHNYDSNMDCEWRIHAPSHYNVQLVFDTIHLEDDENCTFDYVQVFSGMADSSDPMYGQYCGSTIPQNIFTAMDWLVVRFKTDVSHEFLGFSASYVAVDSFQSSNEYYSSYSYEITLPPDQFKLGFNEDDFTLEYIDYNDVDENDYIVNTPFYTNIYQMRIKSNNN